MSRIKATLRFLHARRHPDDIARQVEAELRFHLEMRTVANIEDGMKPEEAPLAALQSFGDFDRINGTCCEIRRSLPFDLTPLKIGLHILIASLAGAAALWVANIPHKSPISVLWQLGFIAVLTCLFIVARRNKRPHRR